jgi:hypothetical protein
MPNSHRWDNISLSDRLLAKVKFGPTWKDGTRCWDWNGAATKKGYGMIYRNGRRVQATRASYEEFVGPMPEGTELDHLCRRPVCVNPLHLEPVDRRTNLLRGNGFAARHARKTHCPQGHAYEGDNLYVTPRGERKCRTCHRNRQRQRRLDTRDMAEDIKVIQRAGQR